MTPSTAKLASEEMTEKNERSCSQSSILLIKAQRVDAAGQAVLLRYDISQLTKSRDFSA